MGGQTKPSFTNLCLVTECHGKGNHCQFILTLPFRIISRGLVTPTVDGVSYNWQACHLIYFVGHIHFFNYYVNNEIITNK